MKVFYFKNNNKPLPVQSPHHHSLFSSVSFSLFSLFCFSPWFLAHLLKIKWDNMHLTHWAVQNQGYSSAQLKSSPLKHPLIQILTFPMVWHSLLYKEIFLWIILLLTMSCFRSKVLLTGRKHGKEQPQEKHKTLNSILIYLNHYLFTFCSYKLKSQAEGRAVGFFPMRFFDHLLFNRLKKNDAQTPLWFFWTRGKLQNFSPAWAELITPIFCLVTNGALLKAALQSFCAAVNHCCCQSFELSCSAVQGCGFLWALPAPPWQGETQVPFLGAQNHRLGVCALWGG